MKKIQSNYPEFLKLHKNLLLLKKKNFITKDVSHLIMITYPEYKINNQTILQEKFDENYEPTEEEIREYAVYIGIDPDKVNY